MTILTVIVMVIVIVITSSEQAASERSRPSAGLGPMLERLGLPWAPQVGMGCWSRCAAYAKFGCTLTMNYSLYGTMLYRTMPYDILFGSGFGAVTGVFGPSRARVHFCKARNQYSDSEVPELPQLRKTLLPPMYLV